MQTVYVVIENGESYPVAFKSYRAALVAVKHKHWKAIKELLSEGWESDSNIDVPEDVKLAKTYLYIEKGIHIYICKLPVAA
jgi:hypothetical protein